MKKIIKKSNCYEMQEKDIEKFAEILAKSFEGYSLFEYFCHKQYDVKKMKLFWKVALCASYNHVYSLSDKEDASGVMVVFPPEYEDISIFSYFKAGGYKFFTKLKIIKMLKFYNFASKIKKKYVNENTCYLYSLAVLQEARGNGIGKKLLKALIEYLDQTEKGCYLETLKKENVALYEHYGFKLVEQVKVPNSDMTLYAMLREVKSNL